jgi:short-subunit dehydrogenase
MAHELARTGANLALVAYPGLDLDQVRQQVEQLGAKAIAIKFNLMDTERLPELLAQVEAQLGPVDVLINNAGVEFTSAYHELDAARIHETIRVNLEAPMMLTRLVLPGMLARRRGHIVNISSLAGAAKPAFQEPYSATKAGLISFTGAVRASYRAQGVSASVVIPGFVEAGIYERLSKVAGRQAPLLLGTCTPERVAKAVRRAVERDRPEVHVTRYPVRPLLALSVLSPRLGAWITDITGANAFFRDAVEASKKAGKSA